MSLLCAFPYIYSKGELILTKLRIFNFGTTIIPSSFLISWQGKFSIGQCCRYLHTIDLGFIIFIIKARVPKCGILVIRNQKLTDAGVTYSKSYKESDTSRGFRDGRGNFKINCGSLWIWNGLGTPQIRNNSFLWVAVTAKNAGIWNGIDQTQMV